MPKRQHGQQLISFVTASGEISVNDFNKTKRTSFRVPASTLSGAEARSFYEDLVSTSGTSHSKTSVSSSSEYKIPTKIKKPKDHCALDSNSTSVKSSASQEKHTFAFLKHAQNGDLVEMKKSLKGHAIIDKQDQFGWTALMCAAYSGHYEIVKYLLDCGASSAVVDSHGQTAKTLAQLAFQHKVVNLLDYCEKHKTTVTKTCDEGGCIQGEPIDSWYCDICQTKVQGSKKKLHFTSTVHMFNQQHKPNPSLYYIPESNRGFQMLLKSGWHTEKGLGPKGQGQKFPVRTVLKTDKAGIGAKTTTAKVTHFGANDSKSVAQPKRTQKAATVKKKSKKQKELKERILEKNFRRQFIME